MNKGGGATYLAACLLILALASQALAVEAARGIAVFLAHDAPPYTETLAGFQERLVEQGWRGPLAVHYLEKGQEQTGDTHPALLLALGETALEKGAASFPDTPTIAGMILDPRLLQRSRHATGVLLEFALATQFEWLARLLPEVRNIGVLYDPALNRELMQQAAALARKRRLTLEEQQVNGPQALPEALKRMPQNIDVLWGVPDATVLAPQTAKQLLLYSFRNRIPLVGLSEAWTKAGALYALDRDYTDIGHQCADLALKVLAGAPAESLAPEGPRKVVLSINTKTAAHMKITLPATILGQAAKVYGNE